MELEPKKQKLINEFKELSKGRSTEEILPLILAVSNKANQMGITFTKDETIALINELSPNLSDKDKARMDMLIKLMF